MTERLTFAEQESAAGTALRSVLDEQDLRVG
jgi:hypothetical protein